jgi:inorganic pyrophosphatase/exopolyphosphatase
MFNIDNEKVTILSHFDPDVDSIISGFLLEKLFRSKGIDASYIIPDKEIDEENYRICAIVGIDANKYKGEVPSDSKLFLVDHYKTSIKGEVIGTIDHHPTSENISYDVYINKPTSSTAMQIYNLDPTVFDIKDIERVVLANIADTNSFLSTKAREEDKEWTLNICEKYNLDYDKLCKIGFCLTDISDIYKSATNGFKEYNYNGKRLNSSYIQVTDMPDNYLSSVIEYLREKVCKEKLTMWVFIVHNMEKVKSDVYLITNNDCEVLNYDMLASRGSTIMPALEKEVNGK